MNIEDFDFTLPERLIAQVPLQDRSASKLLLLNRESFTITHDRFSQIDEYFQQGDVLVVNDTRVLPARLFGVKEDTNAKVEILLLNELNNHKWEVLTKPAKKVKIGTVILFGDGLLRAECVQVKDEGKRILAFTFDGIFLEVLEKLGKMPLPPYIKQELKQPNRYQTVYAKESGSAAAPTAGLHFTKDLLQKLTGKGVQLVTVTLHVGLGTFRPVTVNNIEDHTMHHEYYELSEKNATILNEAKQEGRKIIAVGTTSTRVLETVAQKFNGKFVGASGWSNIFIYPPYEFQAIDGLITNFHLPKSTLLMLLSAFVNREVILQVYDEAIKNEYRFFSFGDAMFILPKRNDNINGSDLRINKNV